MKNLLHDIPVLAALALVSAGVVSCSDELRETGNTEVSFTATIPAEPGTRSPGDAAQVNTLVVGVFKDGVETDRKTFPVSGSPVDMRLTLARNQTYSFVFWAYNDACSVYDITDLTAVKMTAVNQTVTFSQAEAADAFFATPENITIAGSNSYPVTLVRPLAQVNVGTTGNAAPTVFTAKAVPDTFHPFDNTVSGAADFVWNFTTVTATAERFTVDGTEYSCLATGYLFAPAAEAMQMEAEIKLTTGGIGGTTTKTIVFPQVELQANRRSNIVGGFTEE